MLIALFGAVAGQAVVWYTGQFYALFFLEKTLKVDGATANILIAIALALGTPFFIFFGWLSDKIGRKPIIMAGCALAALTYFPLFEALTERRQSGAGHGAQATAPVTVIADPGDCSVQFDPVGKNKFDKRSAATSPSRASPRPASPTPTTPRRTGERRLGSATRVHAPDPARSPSRIAQPRSPPSRRGAPPSPTPAIRPRPTRRRSTSRWWSRSCSSSCSM